MEYFNNPYNLQRGDVVVRNKSALGIIDHYGIYVGNRQVIDNHPNRGVQLISLDDFLNGRTLENVNKFYGNEFERTEIVRRAHSYIGQKYDLYEFNCEDLVHQVFQTGRRSQKAFKLICL